MNAEDVPRIAELALAGRAGAASAHPRSVTREGIDALLHAAWAGEAPNALRR